MAKLMEIAKIKKNDKKSAVAEAGEPPVCVDYPKEDERVDTSGYTFRIGAPAEGKVEICVDGGDWFPCRQAEGYWWFDWNGYPAGEHEVCARIILSDGRAKDSEKRRFTAEAAARG